ncbi:interferon gamma receptor 2 [Psammomys obesus]|uniref:interferon gamma receptor 2 n=1 Tax=Psammomys obesus TaxID=48139 RepID=UPI002452F67D|nr:interferon gamma receptor 2 [Psammomys obesus]
MRPPPLWLPPLLLCGLGAAASPPDPSFQLAAPLHSKIHLYNEEQILTWEPPPPSNDTRPVVYQVEYRCIGASWDTLRWVNCTDTPETKCDISGGDSSKGLSRYHKVFLRVRATLGEQSSDWVYLDPFIHYWNVTVGPPKNISVIPEEGSLMIHFSPPFNVVGEATFQYRVYYWEKTGTQQVKGPFKGNSIVLDNLKPFRVYCLQTEAQLILKDNTVRPPGLLSNVSCHETAADASIRLLQVILIPVGVFTLPLLLTGACFVLFLRHQSRVKYWFQAPPNIPEQIKEYLKDPDQYILEALDKDPSPKDDAWDSVSIIFFPEKEQDDALQTL